MSRKLNPPPNTNQPFFAYGIFKPGQLAFFQLHEYVLHTEPASVKGSLLLRDGLPIIDPSGLQSVKGELLTFRPEDTAEAYKCISDMEPWNHYC